MSQPDASRLQSASRMDTFAITLLTLKVGLVSLLVSVVPGLALAWLLAKKRFPGRTLVQTLVTLPLVVPPVAVGLALLLLLGRRGPVGGFLHRLWGLDILFTWKAAALASAVMAFPLLVRSAQQAFAEVPSRLESVAASLGAGPFAVFRTVTLPMAARGVAYGILLSFARGLGEFGATNLIAGSIPGRTETLALGIYGRVQRGDDVGALVLTCVSVALAFAATYLSERSLAGSAARREAR
jgi:molybdate transport system permease protein